MSDLTLQSDKFWRRWETLYKLADGFVLLVFSLQVISAFRALSMHDR